MGILRNVFGDTVDQMSGCGIIVLFLLPFACVATVMSDRDGDAKKAKSDRTDKVEMCQRVRSMTEHDAIQQCRDNAAALGRDISVDPERLVNCLDSFREKVAHCEADGL